MSNLAGVLSRQGMLLGHVYKDDGQWEKAELLGIQVMETSKEKFRPDHPATLNSMDNLASTYQNQGQWDDVEELEVKVMETRNTKLEVDHPDRLTSMNNPASRYSAQGRWGEAESCLCK